MIKGTTKNHPVGLPNLEIPAHVEYLEDLDEFGMLSWKSMVKAPATSSEALAWLIDKSREVGGEYNEVRTLIANRFDLTDELSQSLISDESPYVRKVLALNRSMPLWGLESLAGDDEPEVRIRVAANPGVSIDLLKRLAADPNPAIREEAAWNHVAPVEILEIGAYDNVANVRKVVLWHNNVSVAVLRTLAMDPRNLVRQESMGRLMMYGSTS